MTDSTRSDEPTGTFVCVTCGTQYPAGAAAPARCPICEDDRQYINHNGQQWTTLAELRREPHQRASTAIDPGMTAIRTDPALRDRPAGPPDPDSGRQRALGLHQLSR